MVFSLVNIAYKQEATSAEINQLMANIVAHDHRADGSQGAALVGQWVDATAALVAGTGWAKTGGYVQRYRVLLGGALVEYDFNVTRTGGGLVADNTAAPRPGNLLDAAVLTGIPAAAIAGNGQNLFAGFVPTMFYTAATASIFLASMVPSGVISTGDTFGLRGVLWRD